MNGGGPDPAGMRNIIEQDRGDAGYSPLWHLWWLTELPMNYAADQVSNSNAITEENGFSLIRTPMFVNCPDVGPVGTEQNLFETEFETKIDRTNMDDVVIQGSLAPFTNDVIVSFVTDSGTTLGNTTSTGAGSYTYTASVADIPEDATALKVMADGKVIRTIEFLGEEADITISSSSTLGVGFAVAALDGILALN